MAKVVFSAPQHKILRLKGSWPGTVHANVVSEELFDANDLNETVMLDEDPRERRTNEGYRLSDRTYNHVSEKTVCS